MNTEETLKKILAEQDEKIILYLVANLPDKEVNDLCYLSDEFIEKVALAYKANKKYGDKVTLESWQRGHEEAIKKAQEESK